LAGRFANVSVIKRSQQALILDDEQLLCTNLKGFRSASISRGTRSRVDIFADPDPGFEIFADLDLGLDFSKICVFFYLRKVKK